MRAAGYQPANGAVYPSTDLGAALRDVARLILLDSAHLQQQDADFLNRHRATRHDPALPLYDEEDARATLKHFVTKQFGQAFALECERGVAC